MECDRELLKTYHELAHDAVWFVDVDEFVRELDGLLENGTVVYILVEDCPYLYFINTKAIVIGEMVIDPPPVLSFNAIEKAQWYGP